MAGRIFIDDEGMDLLLGSLIIKPLKGCVTVNIIIINNNNFACT